MNQEQIKANMLSPKFWGRAVFMLMFALVWWALWLALIVICVVQTIIVMLTSEANSELKKLGSVAVAYLAQVLSFMVFATEEKPFPFSSLPGFDLGSSEAAKPAAAPAAAPAQPAAPSTNVPVVNEVVATADDDEDSFYDPQRDNGATR